MVGRTPDRIHQRGGWRIAIVYRITGYDGVIRPDHRVWNTPLPSIRKPLPGSSAPQDVNAEPITHGNYFQAIRDYLQGEGQDHVRKALMVRYPLCADEFHGETLEIILEKHGEFYHPARILVPCKDGVLSLVLNVAVTPHGRTWMASEINALNSVAGRLPPDGVPAVYGLATVPGANHAPLSMFLADWFEGFHEFHLSIDPQKGRQGMVVWDTTTAPFYLSDRQQAAVYRRAAFLLTRAFNPHTTEQIYPWHHASGDFVLRVKDDALDLRLITVRQYAPTIGDRNGELEAEARLTALLVFFFNLTIRNRLDRLDGTGPPAWADAIAVPETIRGFFDALDEDQSIEVKRLLDAYALDEVMELLSLVAERYQLMDMEKGLIRANLASHGALLHETLQRRFQAH